MGFMKGFRGSALERVMFTLFVLILLAFIIKSITQCEAEKPEELETVTQEEIIQHGYDDPADFAKDTTVSEMRRMYFEKVFHYDDEHKQ